LSKWPDGLAFLLGLLQSTFGLTGFDAVTHLIEEMPRPSRNAPRAIIMAIIMGAATSFVFMIILLLCIRDYDLVVTSPTGPILQIYYQATSNAAGVSDEQRECHLHQATCLLLFNLGGMLFSGQAIMTVSSRMVLTFARDSGLGPLSRLLAPVHPKLKVPLWSLVFVLFWILVFGLIGKHITVTSADA
jgi:amino acid transporter